MKIEELTLFSEDLDAQKHFYSSVLGLSCVEDTTERVGFKMGASRLTIVHKSGTHPVHYALIIPGYSYKAAHGWLKERVELLPFEGEEIIDFPNWNAKSQYFYDPDINIVEFIARRDVSRMEVEVFDPGHIIRIGEVGLPTDDVELLYEHLNAIDRLPKYSGDFDRFGAAGSPEGLFIIVNAGKKDWFPTGDKVYPAHLQVRGSHNFEFQNGIIKELNTPL